MGDFAKHLASVIEASSSGKVKADKRPVLKIVLAVVGVPLAIVVLALLIGLLTMSSARSDVSRSPHAGKADKLGFDPSIGRKLQAGVEAGLLRDLHVVLAERSGTVFLESYGTGQDENWGRPLGTISFDGETLHDLRSVTKSVVSLLYGIALENGQVPGLETPILSQFPEFGDLAEDPERMKRTVRHALTMTLGMEWDETIPYDNPKNSKVAMERARDRYRFILERPLVEEPGKRWVYSGGAVALIGGILERGTGMPIPEFARDALFEPLGITEFEWNKGHDGVASPASGLRLKASDLLKIGRLVLNKGNWNGKQIVPADWIAQSLKVHVPTDQGVNYGYLWWLGEVPVPALGGVKPWAAGFGNGGQRLWISPDANVAAVIYSGNYNDWNAWVTPARIWTEIILLNLQRP